MLQHFSPEENHESILKDGWIKPGYKTGKGSLYGKESKWIYVRINTEINASDSSFHFLIDENILLHTKFILHTGLYSEDYECNEIIDGTKLTKYKLKKMLNKFKEICKLNYEMQKLIGKHMQVHHSNEILIKEDIDLHKYLVEYHGMNKELIEYVKIHYPKVLNL